MSVKIVCEIRRQTAGEVPLRPYHPRMQLEEVTTMVLEEGARPTRLAQPALHSALWRQTALCACPLDQTRSTHDRWRRLDDWLKHSGSADPLERSHTRRRDGAAGDDNAAQRVKSLSYMTTWDRASGSGSLDGRLSSFTSCFSGLLRTMTELQPSMQYRPFLASLHVSRAVAAASHPSSLLRCQVPA